MALSDPIHLSQFDRTIPSGAEWNLVTADWTILQLTEGFAYVFDRQSNLELPREGVLLCPPKCQITITASVLGNATFRGMGIRINSLSGFLTAPERQCLEVDVARRFAPFLSLPAEHPAAKRITQLFAQSQTATLSHRLSFAQTFADLVGPQLLEALKKGQERDKNQMDAKSRLREVIKQVPESELLNLSLADLAKMLHCCERHVSRVFRDECGKGFVPYVSDLRLKKATELLRQGNMKIVDVALESGHGSLAHFNYVFKKRFRMTPTEWREHQSAPQRRRARTRPLQLAAVAIWLLMGLALPSKTRAAAGPGATNAAPPQSAAPATNAVPRTFKVEHYEALGNTLLDTNLINKLLSPFTGEAVGTNAIIKAQEALQKEYFVRGYHGVKVDLPQQKLLNNTVQFQIVEGTISGIMILHNRFFSSNNIMEALPYLGKIAWLHGIPNATVFEAELNRANSNPDRQISSELRAGLDPGTSVIVLDVKDRLPLHGKIDLDNYSPPGTPELRVNANASYGNLWQLDHTLGLQYGFSPEESKPEIGSGTHLSLNPFDSPEVTYYSGFYRAPLGPPVAVEDQIAQNQTHFGYNEITKQFVLPPSIGRPEFSAYASRSTTGPTIYGPESTVVNSSLLTIVQQLISQQYTSQTTVGTRLTFPLPAWKGINSSWSVGMDYKEDKVVTLPTNNFYYTTIVTHGSQSAGPPTITRSTISIAGVPTYPSLQYTPFFLGLTASRPDHWLEWGKRSELSSEFDGSLSFVAGTGGTFSRERPFPGLIANTPEATTEFVAFRPQLSRTQILPDNFTFYENMSGQWANIPLLNLEQFSLGGNATVRGYREGELYADSGFVEQSEFRSPYYTRGLTGMKIATQFTVFNDYGRGYLLDAGGAPNASQALWGAGAGINFKFGKYVESHILIAWPLLNSAFSTAGRERISFSLSAQL